MDSGNSVFNLFVLFADDGKRLDFTIGLIDQEAQVLAHEVPVVDPNIVAMTGKASLCHITFVTVDSEGGAHVVERDAPRFQSAEDPREGGLAGVVPSVEDVEPLEVLDSVARILKTLPPGEVREATEAADVNLTEHELSLCTGLDCQSSCETNCAASLP